MKTMDNVKRRIITSMVAILLLIITIFGITYAYFVSNVRGNTEDKSISVSAGILELTYMDGNGVLDLYKYLIPGEPVTFKDKDGKEVSEKTFSIENTGTKFIEDYEVVLQNLVNELKYYEDLTYTLTCKSSIEGNNCNGSSGVFLKTDGVLVVNSIDVNEIHYYTLKLVYHETNKDQSNDMNKNISAKINIQDNESDLKHLIVYGNSVQDGTPSVDNPIEIKSVGDKTKNLLNSYFDSKLWVSDNVITTHNYVNSQIVRVKPNTNYTLSALNLNDMNGKNLRIWETAEYPEVGGDINIRRDFYTGGEYKFKTLENTNYLLLSTGDTSVNNYEHVEIQLEEGTQKTEYGPYNKYKISVVANGVNLFDISKTKATSQTINGLTFTPLEDERVHIKGTIEDTSKAIYYYMYPTKQGNMPIDAGIYRSKPFSISGISILFGVRNYADTYYVNVNSVNKSEEVKEDGYITGVLIHIKTNSEVTEFDDIVELQMVHGTTDLPYEPYKEPIVSNIYLNEPLRRVGDVADYIDFYNSRIVRYIKVIDDTGTKSIEESYEVLKLPIQETIQLPSVVKNNTSSINIETEIEPSKIEY